MKLKFYILIVCITFLYIPTSFAANDRVTVGLYYGSTALAKASVSSAGGLASYPAMEISGAVTVVYMDNNSIAIYDETGQNMLGQGAADEIITLTPADNIISIEGKRYRGSLLFKPTTSGMTVINDVGLEEYLCGVVPKEAWSSWPAEALKAQAVASRSLVYSALKDKHIKLGFSLCATTNCQVYGGVDGETKGTTDAVYATAGLVGVYNGKVAHTLYSASNGGFTEAPVNVWGGTYPYLTSFADPYDEADQVKGMVWTVTATADEIVQGVLKYGGNIGSLTGVKVLETAASGRVVKLEVTGTAGSFVLNNEQTRAFLNLKSQMYTITAPGTGLVALTDGGAETVTLPAVGISADGNAAVTDTVSILTDGGVEQYIPVVSGEYTIQGRGYGHGVGMSQWGAKTMSDQGFTYDQIISFYFPGVTIGSLDDIAH